jgi:hypothetical protein
LCISAGTASPTSRFASCPVCRARPPSGQYQAPRPRRHHWQKLRFQLQPSHRSLLLLLLLQCVHPGSRRVLPCSARLARAAGSGRNSAGLRRLVSSACNAAFRHPPTRIPKERVPCFRGQPPASRRTRAFGCAAVRGGGAYFYIGPHASFLFRQSLQTRHSTS